MSVRRLVPSFSADASRAGAVLAVLRRRAVRADAENDGYQLVRSRAAGLGDDSWGYHSDDVFIYGWRHNNVVVVADMYCGEGSCEAGVARALAPTLKRSTRT